MFPNLYYWNNLNPKLFFMDKNLLVQTAQAMVKKGKGILAIDESSSTCKKRFDAVGVDCTEENRRAYRELLITAPGVEQYISGMILYDETLRQSTKAGVSFVKALNDKGMIAGIKVELYMKVKFVLKGLMVCVKDLLNILRSVLALQNGVR